MVSTECSSSVRQMLISTEKRGWVLGVGVLGTFRYVSDFMYVLLVLPCDLTWHVQCGGD